MKVLSVDSALKELQNDIFFFPASCLVQALYLVKFTSRKVPVPRLYWYLQQYKAQPNKKDIILWLF